MLVLSTSAERDLVQLIAYLCCSQELREGICAKLADYLEVNAYRDDLGKTEQSVDRELNVLSVLFRAMAQCIQNLRTNPQFTPADVNAAALAWLHREIKSAQARRADVRGF